MPEGLSNKGTIFSCNKEHNGILFWAVWIVCPEIQTFSNLRFDAAGARKTLRSAGNALEIFNKKKIELGASGYVYNLREAF